MWASGPDPAHGGNPQAGTVPGQQSFQEMVPALRQALGPMTEAGIPDTESVGKHNVMGVRNETTMPLHARKNIDKLPA